WHFAGTGDFNGDGRSDILWSNDAGQVFNFLGTANGGVANNGDNSWMQLPSGWTVAGVGDLNGDGRTDLLLRNADGTISDDLADFRGGFTDNSSNLFTN